MVQVYLIFHSCGSFREVFFVHVAHGHYTGVIVWYVATAHSAHTDNSFG